jgi:hypothetical protein
MVYSFGSWGRPEIHNETAFEAPNRTVASNRHPATCGAVLLPDKSDEASWVKRHTATFITFPAK